MTRFWTRKKTIIALGIVMVLAGGWWQHRPLLARYYVRQLRQANETDREAWVTRIVALDAAAIPALLAALEDADQQASENLGLVLISLARTWGAEDARSIELLERLSERFPSLPTQGKNCVLQVPIVFLTKANDRPTPPVALTRLAGEFLSVALTDEALRVASLRLAAALLTQVPHGQWLDTCRDLAQKSLIASAPATRVAGIQLLLRPPLRHETDLLVKVMPLLRDPAAPVRKNALLALGSAPAVLSDEDLLPLLHDPDDEVQNLCELALRSRGLQENHILLARYISDARPAARLRVVELLRETHDLEPGVWLRRLCQDPAPAVRAAAIRAAVSQSQVDMRACLADMAEEDPSLTVRQLAAHYLQHSQVSAQRP